MTNVGIKSRPARAPGDPTRQMADHARVLDEVSREAMLNRKTVVVTLPDATAVSTVHGLGRTFENFACSPPIGPVAAGYIEEVEGDPTREFILKATGYGATIKVRVTCW